MTSQVVLEDAHELLEEGSRLLELLFSTTKSSGACQAYTLGTARKEVDRLLVEFPYNPNRTRFV
jgi:hypothetical protein